MKAPTDRPGNRPRRMLFIATACICVAVLPLLILLGYSLYQSQTLQSSQRIEQRIFGARLAAATIASELNSIRVFGAWYSQSPDVRTLVKERRWDALSVDMDRVVEHLPAVVRLFASDRQGRLWADSPRKPEVHGVDFSFRDWFKGAIDGRDVYFSQAYRRTAEPRIQVASMAFPVNDGDGEIIGVVVFQLSLDAILSWVTHAPLNGAGSLVLVDQHEQSFTFDEGTGQVLLDPAPVDDTGRRRPASDSGHSAAIAQNDGREVVVHAGIPGWKWEIRISESSAEFFAGRNQERRTVIVAVVLILILCFVSAGAALVMLRVLVRKEWELTRANAGLVSANRNLHDFTHAVSHDLRAPLRAMSGYAEALVEDQGENLDDQGRHYLERIKAGSHKLGGMIEDLLAVARIPQTDARLQEVDLSRVAHDIVDEIRAGEPDRKADVRIQPDMQVRGDPTLLALVLRNLLHNAWKFTRNREQADIEFGREQAVGETAFFVRDNGAGFDPEYTDKLFSMFQRLHSEGEFEGTGIGLAATRQAVERHGGRIWAEGREGAGATFHFTVPSGSESTHGD